jgi:hypothetical protein
MRAINPDTTAEVAATTITATEPPLPTNRTITPDEVLAEGATNRAGGVTPDEVLAWFKRGHGPWPSVKRCKEVSGRINKMRWPDDPPKPNKEPEPFGHWWDALIELNVEQAAARAKALLDDLPAMLCFWHGLQEAPKEWLPIEFDGIELPEGVRKEDLVKQFVPGLRVREGYDVIDQLRVALTAALPYIESPFGKYEKLDHRKRKRPKDWHAHAVAIAPVIAEALNEAGHEVRSTSHNTILVRVVREALLRIGYANITEEAVAKHLTGWYGGHGRKILGT